MTVLEARIELDRVIASVSAAYGDGWEVQASHDPTGLDGDTLAAFVASEIAVSYIDEPDLSSGQCRALAIRRMNTAKQDLDVVIDALNAHTTSIPCPRQEKTKEETTETSCGSRAPYLGFRRRVREGGSK